jgi:isoleucyl-tRNA synthetase
MAREIINRIQRSRKDLNFNVEDRIQIKANGSDQVINAIEEFKAHIMKETLATSIVVTKDLKDDSLKFDIDKHQLELELNK